MMLRCFLQKPMWSKAESFLCFQKLKKRDGPLLKIYIIIFNALIQCFQIQQPYLAFKFRLLLIFFITYTNTSHPLPITNFPPFFQKKKTHSLHSLITYQEKTIIFFLFYFSRYEIQTEQVKMNRENNYFIDLHPRNMTKGLEY